MSLLKVKVLVIFVIFFGKSTSQEYDFGAEISRQCLVPDPVGLLDCVENKVTLPYLQSWVDCTNSLGQNVRTSADIINYRCKSVWEGKGVIPEVFYIKDCVIEKTGLPAKNVSAEVLGAYKECERSPTQPRQDSSQPLQQQQVIIPPPQQISSIKSAPLQPVSALPQSSSSVKSAPLQQVAALPQSSSSVKSAPILQQQQQYIGTTGPNYSQTFSPPPVNVQRQPYSRQFFVIYPQSQIQSQIANTPFIPQQQSFLSQQQVPVAGSAFISQQQPAPTTGNFVAQQQLPVSTGAFAPQQQQPAPFLSQQQLSSVSYVPQTQQGLQPIQSSASVPSGPYYYGFEIFHPQRLI